MRGWAGSQVHHLPGRQLSQLVRSPSRLAESSFCRLNVGRWGGADSGDRETSPSVVMV